MAKSKKKTEEILDDNQVELQDISEELEVEIAEEIKQELPHVKNVEELILQHIDSQKGEDDIELNGILQELYTNEDSFIVAKKAYQLLTKMSAEGKIKMSDVNWTQLSQHYHEADGRARKYLLSDIKILAKK